MSQIVAVPIDTKGSCERIVVKTADGRAFDLGKPDSFLFPLRRWIYIWKRRKEMKHG